LVELPARPVEQLVVELGLLQDHLFVALAVVDELLNAAAGQFVHLLLEHDRNQSVKFVYLAENDLEVGIASQKRLLP
jgi:hypothetical protein